MYGESSVCKKYLSYALGWCRKERQKNALSVGLVGKADRAEWESFNINSGFILNLLWSIHYM